MFVNKGRVYVCEQGKVYVCEPQ